MWIEPHDYVVSVATDDHTTLPLDKKINHACTMWVQQKHYNSCKDTFFSLVLVNTGIDGIGPLLLT